MRRNAATTVALVALLAACSSGPDDADPVGSSDGNGTSEAADEQVTDTGAASGGSVVDPQPPGQATVSVDGQSWTLTDPGAVDCSIAADELAFSFVIGDNEVTLGGGAVLAEEIGWTGTMNLQIANPADGPGPVGYSPEPAAIADGVAVDGDSMSYSGPMLRQPPNDGSNPLAEPAGDGTISVTC